MRVQVDTNVCGNDLLMFCNKEVFMIAGSDERIASCGGSRGAEERCLLQSR